MVVAAALAATTTPQIIVAEQPVATPILVVDQERLFLDSDFGTKILAEIDMRSNELAAENRRIEAELVAEERELTEIRSTVSLAEFRPMAAAFDAKVQALRQGQDAKVRDVTRLREDARQRFYAEVGGILSELLHERGAVALMDRRALFLAVEGIDITDVAIDRVNAAFGDNLDLTDPPSEDPQPEPAE